MILEKKKIFCVKREKNYRCVSPTTLLPQPPPGRIRSLEGEAGLVALLADTQPNFCLNSL